MPFRKESRPESGDGGGEEEEEEEEEVEEARESSPRRIVLECGRTRGTRALNFGIAAHDVEMDAERIVTGQRSAPRRAIAKARESSKSLG